MDTKTYFRKIRALEQQIEDRDVVVVSLDTPVGGKAGLAMETTRFLACKLVVEGKARLATAEEAAQFQNDKKAAYEEALQSKQPIHGEIPVTYPSGAKPGKTTGRSSK